MAVSGGGNRPTWEQLPEHVQSAIEQLLEAPVRSAASQPGGFTPGFASRLELADGRRAFVKAGHASQNPNVPIAYAREAAVVRQLPVDVPSSKLLDATTTADGWEILAFQDLEGRNPHEPWVAGDLDRVLHGLTVLSDSLTPAPIPAAHISDDLSEAFTQWRTTSICAEDLRPISAWLADNLERLPELEEEWEQAAQGETLLHLDIRADNIVLTSDSVVFVDWNFAATGAAWIDLLGMLPSVLMQSDFDGEGIVQSHPLTRAVEPEKITAFLVAIMGYFVIGSFEPPPVGIPTVRDFQRRQGLALANWLERRLA